LSEVLSRDSALQIVVAARSFRLRDDCELAEPGSEADYRFGALGETLRVGCSPSRQSRLQLIEACISPLARAKRSTEG
jgi:hypothetical protein